MLANIIGVDEAMIEAALHANNPAAVFFGFQAAFPSVLHSFLLGVLKHIGLPAPILSFVVCVYLGNHCSLIIGGARYPGFLLWGGIRQGCPLSPLCFAIAADLLLHAVCPGSFLMHASEHTLTTWPWSYNPVKVLFPSLFAFFKNTLSSMGCTPTSPRQSLCILSSVSCLAQHQDSAQSERSWFYARPFSGGPHLW